MRPSAKTSDTIPSPSAAQFHRLHGERMVGLKRYCAYALMLCGLAAPANAAGIQLLDLDPAPCLRNLVSLRRHVRKAPLGALSVGPDTAPCPAMKDCPPALSRSFRSHHSSRSTEVRRLVRRPFTTYG